MNLIGKYSRRLIRLARQAAWLCAAATALCMNPGNVCAQVATRAVPSPSALPDAIFWKQDLFLIPYQFSSAAEPAAAQAVWLFVSKDRGASWQKISEAKPQVKAFNYRADGEGEYWFAIRTLDYHGRTWPEGAYQPELRVVVDTTIPRIESLQAQILPTGQVEIAWVCSDLNLDPDSIKMEAQLDTAGAWQAVPVSELTAGSPPVLTTSAIGTATSGRIQWPLPVGSRPIAVRATISDRAGNSATFRSEINLVATHGYGTPGDVSSSTGAGWTTPATMIGMQTSQTPTSSSQHLPANQPWQATSVEHSPFRLSNVSTEIPNDGVTSYGSLPITTATSDDAETPPTDRGTASPQAEGPPRGASPNLNDTKISEGGVEQAPETGPRYAALDPFRQTTVRRLPAAEQISPTARPAAAPPSVTPVNSPKEAVVPPQAKRVGSRTFALEYDLDNAGRWGVSNVELWGTRDGGRTWQSFARDDDHRSPLIVTVDQEGLYGFRIAVDSAGSAASPPPSSGDAPELWVSVDMRRPSVELTAIERGTGNMADHLVFRWKAKDDDLELRPISLFYSSRPTGPWSAIATSLEDTGEYAWRVERHVPARFFVRIEARDSAGNLAAFQTREPVDVASSAPSGHLRSAEPAGPTAAQSNGTMR